METLDRGAAGARCHATVTRRVVLLGASNLTKSIGTVIGTAAAVWGGPLDVLGAWGHGRSYGRASRLFGRELPGIEECGLWADLAAAPEVPAAALVTDIGNDLLYEEPVEQILAWVEQCLDRLAAAQARTIVTLWPIENLRTLSRARYYLMRTLLVPSCRLSLEEIGRRAIAVDEAVEQLTRARGMRVARHQPNWYGFDPIHIRMGHRRHAWRELLGGWHPDGRLSKSTKLATAQSLYLRTRVPEQQRLFGIKQRGRKPSARLADGTTVTIY